MSRALPLQPYTRGLIAFCICAHHIYTKHQGGLQTPLQHVQQISAILHFSGKASSAAIYMPKLSKVLIRITFAEVKCIGLLQDVTRPNLPKLT